MSKRQTTKRVTASYAVAINDGERSFVRVAMTNGSIKVVHKGQRGYAYYRRLALRRGRR